MAKITPEEIPRIRLLAQQLSASSFKKAGDLVTYMGAMQAQDLNMAMWAIGSRLPGSTITSIEKALDKGEIIRTSF